MLISHTSLPPNFYLAASDQLVTSNSCDTAVGWVAICHWLLQSCPMYHADHGRSRRTTKRDQEVENNGLAGRQHLAVTSAANLGEQAIRIQRDYQRLQSCQYSHYEQDLGRINLLALARFARRPVG